MLNYFIEILIPSYWKVYFKSLPGNKDIFKFSLIIYFLSIMAASVFYSAKPVGFPEGGVGAQMEGHSIAFWLAMGFLGFFLTIASAYLMMLALYFLESRWITFTDLLAVLFSAHAYYLVLFIVIGTATMLRNAAIYKISELALSLLGFIFTIVGVKIIAKTSASKALLVMLVSSLGIVAAIFGLHLAGILPKSLLKVIL
ncbi:hypothetical protein ACFL6Y_07675, partial [Elusimicrobiota bacterium]